MKSIRKSVFETNSSSTHSISIDATGVCEPNLSVENGICQIYGGEFGWEVEDYRDARTKASYCLTYIMTIIRDEARRDCLGIMLTKVVKEVTGARDVMFCECGKRHWDDKPNYGYIDHQSDYVCAEAFESEEALKQFIFCPGSVLHTDNDNH